MKNSSFVSGRVLRKALVCFMLLLTAGSVKAQVGIPGTKVKYTFPSQWSYISSEKVDANTMMYLYAYEAKTVCYKGDTTLPVLRILVRKNYMQSVNDYVFDRWSESPYQPLKDYTTGLGLPKTGGMGYIGAYTNTKDKKDYQFRMVYFKVQNTVVEFRLETTRETFDQMDGEFTAILKSLTF